MSTFEELDQAVREQGVIVRDLKDKKADKAEIQAAVAILVAHKAKLAEWEKANTKPTFNRERLEQLLRQRFIVAPSFDIYGGVAGFFDFGPPGCAIKANLLSFWRQHFVMEESMLEVDCPSMTPEVVLKTSGHVERFLDLMVRDVKTNDCYRADHLLEEAMDALLGDAKNRPTPEQRAEYERIKGQADAYTADELHAKLQQFNVKFPGTGNDITEPFPFNLMFASQIGPTGYVQGYLRPETAQNIFINFRRLLEYNNGKLPFAAAQVGQAFRNEIAPRAGLLRVREFTLAEIEHFVNPDDKSHPRFPEVKDVKIIFFGRDAQTTTGKHVEMTIGEAVEKGVVGNTTHGYFMARVQQFLEKVGIDPARLRFRQHLSNEMAHYACDCWDAEIELSYGWTECVGIADRAAYDLSVHAKASKVDLVAREIYQEARSEEVLKVKLNRGAIGKTLRKEAKTVIDSLESMSKEDAMAMQAKLDADGKAPLTNCDGEFEITKDMVTFSVVTELVHGRNYTPGVIEPSFGIGRILYAILEHSYYVREVDEQRGVFGFSPIVAPYKAAILPLSYSEDFHPIIKDLRTTLTGQNISSKVDESKVSIGKRYSRVDEVGVPFALTVDFQSIKDRTVTIRERDSTQQIRTSVEDASVVIAQLVNGSTTWTDVVAKYGLLAAQAEE